MFSSQLGRVARAGNSCTAHVSRTPVCLFAAAAAAGSSPSIPLSRQPQMQQRRPSSSKASCPPDGNSNGARPAAPAQAAVDPARSTSGRSSNGRKTAGRRSRDSAAVTGPVAPASASASDASSAPSPKTKEANEAFDNLPSVPSTNHMQPQDITLSSFFSLHRPLSLAPVIPPNADIETFNKIFEPKSKQSKNPADVIYTLSNTIDALESSTQEESDLRWEIIQESTSNSTTNIVKHLDGIPRAKTIEELVAQLKPFTTPPPPQAIDEKKFSKSRSKSAHQPLSGAELEATPSTSKSFKTTIIVTELTSAAGRKTYTASTSPMEEIATSSLDHEEPDSKPSMSDGIRKSSRQTFLERMSRRQAEFEEFRDERAERREEGGMHALSVKRQRKLKMKKHKYKKLMKRTRNLRRRLDRA